MPVAFVRSHSVQSIKSLNNVYSPAIITTATTAGNLLVLALVHDNYSAANTPTITSITVPASETASWVFLGRATYPSAGTAGAFSCGELWAIKTTVS